MARLRISDHPLQIEAGRYNQTPPNNRLCTLCNSNRIENEVHFILECSLYNDMRNSFISAINVDTRCKELTNDNLFVHIMTTTDNFVQHKSSYTHVLRKGKSHLTLDIVIA